MLLKFEKLLTRDDVAQDASDEEMFQIVRNELTNRIVSDMIGKGLVKVEVLKEFHNIFGPLTKVRASVRVYNPDD